MTDSQNAGPLLRDGIRQRLDFNVMHCPKYHEQMGFEPARHIKHSRNPARIVSEDFAGLPSEDLQQHGVIYLIVIGFAAAGIEAMLFFFEASNTRKDFSSVR